MAQFRSNFLLKCGIEYPENQPVSKCFLFLVFEI